VVGIEEMPSSIDPLQLLSTPSQISLDGVPGVQVRIAPAIQICTVRWHAPTPQVVLPNPSSTCPSQFSSMLLQVSVAPG